MDRLGRTTNQLIELSHDLKERGISLQIISLGVDTSTPAYKPLGLEVEKEVEMALLLYDSRKYTIKEITEQTGVSKAKLYQVLNVR
ncbi:recombinase family protein [Paenibacillus prosopidis]|uniref:recombinase family protein n=1 Tax=Paenibacillus prosopidis TaxID=630520 RepID=UPI0015F1AD0D